MVNRPSIFYGPREFRVRDARTSFIHLEFIRYKIDMLWKSSLIVINSSYGLYLVKTRETLVQTTAIVFYVFLNLYKLWLPDEFPLCWVF